MTLADVLAITERTGHSTVAVTEDGTAGGKFVGIVTNKDYRVSRMSPDTKVKEFMTEFSKIVCAGEDTTLKEANDIIWEHKINCLPLVNKNQELVYLVFRKDYDTHKKNENELIDASKRSWWERGSIPGITKSVFRRWWKAGADVLCIDSSEGFSEWQKMTLDYIRSEYGDSVKVGAGNVVDCGRIPFPCGRGSGFCQDRYRRRCHLYHQRAEGNWTRTGYGADRGSQSPGTNIMKRRGSMFPSVPTGGIVHDYHITLALAMGADFVMLGRYFARFDESPTKRVNI